MSDRSSTVNVLGSTVKDSGSEKIDSRLRGNDRKASYR